MRMEDYVVTRGEGYTVFLLITGVFIVVPDGVGYRLEDEPGDVLEREAKRLGYAPQNYLLAKAAVRLRAGESVVGLVDKVYSDSREKAAALGYALEEHDAVRAVTAEVGAACCDRVWKYLGGRYPSDAVRQMVSYAVQYGNGGLCDQIVSMPEMEFKQVLLPKFAADLEVCEFDTAVDLLLHYQGNKGGVWGYDSGRDMLYVESPVFAKGLWDKGYSILDVGLKYKKNSILKFLAGKDLANNRLWFDLHSLFGNMTEVFYEMVVNGGLSDASGEFNVYDAYTKFLVEMLGAGVAARSLLLAGIPEYVKLSSAMLDLHGKVGDFFYLLFCAREGQQKDTYVILDEKFASLSRKIDLQKMNGRYRDDAMAYAICVADSYARICDNNRLDVGFVFEDNRLLLKVNWVK